MHSIDREWWFLGQECYLVYWFLYGCISMNTSQWCAQYKYQIMTTFDWMKVFQNILTVASMTKPHVFGSH